MKWFLILAVSVVVGSAYFWYTVQPQEVVIRITDSGFVPSAVTIGVGDTIRFVSEVDRETWPASDSHPSHGLYTEFDSLAPLSSRGEWEFVFDRPGVWDFHDHMLAEVQGTITVLGEFGAASLECTAIHSGMSRAKCWESDFTKLITDEGFDAAFKKFVMLYDTDEEFRTYCHDTMHYIGRAAHTVYALDQTVITRPETSFCGYGFYHGFIESALESEGAASLSNARQYCEEMGVSKEFGSQSSADNASSACKHGIGHAVFDSLDGALWGNALGMTTSGIATCESVFFDDTLGQRQCVTGIYNSLVTAIGNHDYNLTYEKLDPDTYCLSQKDIYQPFCFLDIATSYTRDLELSLEEGVKYTERYNDTEARALAIYGIVDDRFRLDPANVDMNRYYDVCMSVESGSPREYCIKGTVLGVTTSSHRGEDMVRQVTEFCNLFVEESEERSFCFLDASRVVKSRLTDEEFALSCTTSPELETYCNQ